MSYLCELDQIYKHIDAKSTKPQAQPSFDGHCKALWCGAADFVLNSHAEQLYNKLNECFGHNAYIFKPGAEATAALHWTLFQFQTFLVEPSPTIHSDRTDALAIAKIIGKFPPIHISFRGIVRTRYGLFLAGYPSWDINKLRAAFREWGKADIKEPHPQDICHATLLRFYTEPSDADIEVLDKIVNELNGILLGELKPKRWYYGYGTWLQSVTTTPAPHLIASWPATPQHWILHRGLLDGPDPILENSQERLLEALAAGWDVELDIWVRDGLLYLGHDWPVAEAGGPVEPFFLPFRGAWVHCKNMEALQYMLETQAKCHYFVHDSDEATLTNTGEAWCYPGKSAGHRSICVLPERMPIVSAATAIFTKPICGICSDYTPSYFILQELFTFF